MLTQGASNPRVQPNELKVAAHQFQPAVRSELFGTELDRKLSLDRPPQPPYLQPHLWGLSCRLSCVAAVLQMTRQSPLFFDQIVESTRFNFGLRLITGPPLKPPLIRGETIKCTWGTSYLSTTAFTS